MNNQLDILSKLSLYDRDQLPNAIFFFRHINDLDFSMPLVLFATNAKVIFYGKIKMNDRRVKLLIDRNIQINFLNTRLINTLENISDYIIAFLKKINFFHASKFLKLKIDFIINNLLKIETLKLIQSSDMLEFSSIFNFDHTACVKSKTIIQILRNQSTKERNISIISLPHGDNIFQNKMIDYNQLDLVSYDLDFYHFDHVVCNNRMHFNSINGNKIILPSLRYTKEWQHYLANIYTKNLEDKSIKKELTILFLLSKIEGGINFLEIQRAIKIIDNFENIKLKIKPHPRGLREIKKLNILSSSLVLGDVLEHMPDADCIINVQSNAVFDAYLLKKPVIFPKYMTSNDWNENVKSHALVANTPDDFFQFIEKFSKNEALPIPDYKFREWKDLLSNWNDFFSSLA